MSEEKIETSNPHGAAVIAAIDPVRTVIVASATGDLTVNGREFVKFTVIGPGLKDAWQRWHRQDGKKLDPPPDPRRVLLIYDRLHAAIRQIQDGSSQITIHCWEVCRGR